MKFHATDEQVAEICANAYNASRAEGMGFLHYVPGDVTGAQCLAFVQRNNRSIDLDYIQGRMIKLEINRRGVDEWEILDSEPHPSYQSWARKFPTHEALLASVTGITIEPAQAGNAA